MELLERIVVGAIFGITGVIIIALLSGVLLSNIHLFFIH